MKRTTLLLSISLLALTTPTFAGTITGKVAGPAGVSVVYLEGAAGQTFPAPTSHVTVSQKSLQFQPHLVVVQAGTTVDFLNSDGVAHNVFWPSFQEKAKKSPGKNLGTWPQGDTRSFQFDRAGVASLLCNVHPEMSGFIVVSPTPYFAQTDAAGNFRIENVPNGQYTAYAWHEGAKLQTKPLAVSGDSALNFEGGK
jgi:plastocyanin